jgi:hypothetical protein
MLRGSTRMVARSLADLVGVGFVGSVLARFGEVSSGVIG